MLTLVFYNAGLQLLKSYPDEVLKHSAIQNDSKRRQRPARKILLDLVVHQPALSSDLRENRGRPDIVHQVLLQYLFAVQMIKNYEFTPPCIIHTIEDRWFKVPIEWKPPVNYIRFRGLMEQFLWKKKLKVATDTFMVLQKGSLEAILQNLNPKKLIVFTSHAKALPLPQFYQEIWHFHQSKNNFVGLIGLHQKGPMPAWLEHSQLWTDKIIKYALIGGRLPAWRIAAYLMQAIEFEMQNK